MHKGEVRKDNTHLSSQTGRQSNTCKCTTVVSNSNKCTAVELSSVKIVSCISRSFLNLMKNTNGHPRQKQFLPSAPLQEGRSSTDAVPLRPSPEPLVRAGRPRQQSESPGAARSSFTKAELSPMSAQMEDLLQCALCSEPYDLEGRRPASLICGDAICRQCVNDPTWRRDCPVCVQRVIGRRQVDHRTFIPDNKLVIQIMGTSGEQAAEENMEEESEDKPADTICDAQLQTERGLEAGQALVARLELEVPTAVQSLRSLLDKAVSNMQMLKVADCVLRQTGGPDVYSATDHATTQMVQQQLQLAEKLLDGYSILSGGDSQCVADDSLLRQGSLGRLLLLKMQMEGERSGRKGPSAASGPAWPPPASELPLEEARIPCGDDARVMEAVRGMRSLRRLRVAFRSSADEHPELPLFLDELAITNASERDLLRVQRMHSLRRLMLDGYDGPYVSFDASARPPAAGLREIAVDFKVGS
ncbi:Roquin-1 [Frankliniella fusca]|uniref:Roquin-1 n=1 Tax=Frankliniella fusca TaxID=407009 RepID=A0AAE1H521_9NEOP|nr:Roquin-1 [Frankliniella fusca]